MGMATHGFLPGAICAGLVLPVLSACGGDAADRTLRLARDRIAASLPAPYFEDLVVESVVVEGDALVQLIRSPGGNAAKIRDNPRFEELRQSEQDELARLCDVPAIRPLAVTDARLVRRFIDRDGGVFFEVEMPARSCAATGE